MGFTDDLIRAVTQELAHRRVELDTASDVRNVKIAIHINQKTNRPRSVIFSAERERMVETRGTTVAAQMRIKHTVAR
jgi:DNA topoisomerase VI subunit B